MEVTTVTAGVALAADIQLQSNINIQEAPASMTGTYDEGGVTNCTSIKTTNVPSLQRENSNIKNIQKKKMKVYFKDGPEIISGYLEPQDPWKNAESWVPEELENAYRLACSKHGIKPLQCLIQQLKIFKDIKDRYEVLNLKGEKLDLKQCECLEEIFRRLQFRTINLEATHLDDECVVALFDMVEHYESACKIDMSFNKNIGIRGWQACSRAIKRTPCLVHLDVRNCDLNERYMSFIGRSLRMGCHLHTLHMENASLAGRSLMILVAGLKVNETLKELFLGDNKLMPTDAIHLNTLISNNHHLSLLDLRNNPLQDTGLRHISEGLQVQDIDSGLNTLVLWNTQISFQGMTALSPALVFNIHLQTLNLAHNNINNEGIFRLKEGLLANKSLLRVGLQATKLSCEAAIALAEVIADSRHLLRVDLRENDIRTAGLMALSLALKVNETVTKLDLDKDSKKESRMKDYADQQRRLQQDIAGYLVRNQSMAAKKELERKQATEDFIVEKKTAHANETLENNNSTTRRPETLSTRRLCQQESLDSPGLIPDHVDPLKVIPVVPIVPNTLNIELEREPLGDFILSPQYQREIHAQLLPGAKFTLCVDNSAERNRISIKSATGDRRTESRDDAVIITNEMRLSSDATCEQRLCDSSQKPPSNHSCNSKNVATEIINEIIVAAVATNAGDVGDRLHIESHPFTKSSPALNCGQKCDVANKPNVVDDKLFDDSLQNRAPIGAHIPNLSIDDVQLERELTECYNDHDSVLNHHEISTHYDGRNGRNPHICSESSNSVSPAYSSKRDRDEGSDTNSCESSATRKLAFPPNSQATVNGVCQDVAFAVERLTIGDIATHVKVDVTKSAEQILQEAMSNGDQ